MANAQVGDLTIHYEIRGNGPKLLFICGSGGFAPTRAILDSPLAEPFTLVGYDQRGQGETDAPEGPYTMAGYAEDARGLLDALGWERCHVLGLSFSGMVAQELALRHPLRIERLVLAGTSSGGGGGSSYPLHELADMDPASRAKAGLGLMDTRRGEAWQTTHPKEVEAAVAQAWTAAEAAAADLKRQRGSRLLLQARRLHNTYDRLPSLTMPVYVCGSTYDGIAPSDNQKAMARQIPQARLELFDGGHGTFLWQDSRAFPQIIAFLKGELDT